MSKDNRKGKASKAPEAPRPVAGPISLRVELSDRADKDLADLEKVLGREARVAFLAAANALISEWPASPRIAKKVRSSRNGLWELRMRIGNNQPRFLFVVDAGLVHVITGGLKKSEGEFDRMVDQGDRMVTEWRNNERRPK